MRDIPVLRRCKIAGHVRGRVTAGHECEQERCARETGCCHRFLVLDISSSNGGAVWRLCSRPTANASHSHSATAAMLTTANILGESASCVPPNTRPAARTSPKRTKNVSIAAFALYLASALVGSHSIWRTVLWSE